VEAAADGQHGDLQRVIGMTSKTFGRRGTISAFAEIALTGPLFGGDTIYAEVKSSAWRRRRSA